MYRVKNNTDKGIQWHATNPDTNASDPFYVMGGATVVVADYAVDAATDLQPYIDASQVTVNPV